MIHFIHGLLSRFLKAFTIWFHNTFFQNETLKHFFLKPLKWNGLSFQVCTLSKGISVKSESSV